jgi:hypothetical protein
VGNALARYGSLLVTAGLLIGGAFELPPDDGQGAVVLLVAGLISFGMWLTLEVHFLLHGRTQHDDGATLQHKAQMAKRKVEEHGDLEGS